MTRARASSLLRPANVVVAIAVAGLAVAGCGGTQVDEDTNPPNIQETVPVPGEPSEAPS